LVIHTLCCLPSHCSDLHCGMVRTSTIDPATTPPPPFFPYPPLLGHFPLCLPVPPKHFNVPFSPQTLGESLVPTFMPQNNRMSVPLLFEAHPGLPSSPDLSYHGPPSAALGNHSPTLPFFFRRPHFFLDYFFFPSSPELFVAVSSSPPKFFSVSVEFFLVPVCSCGRVGEVRWTFHSAQLFFRNFRENIEV